MVYAENGTTGGIFLIGRRFEEITFCSKDTFNTVDRQLIQNAVLPHRGQ